MQIVRTKIFKKNFDKLPSKIKMQFNERFLLFLENSSNPLLRNHALHGEMSGRKAFSISGDYRAIYRVVDHETLVFLNIGTHNQVY